MRNVLVVSSVPEIPPEVREELGKEASKVHVVAPAVKQSRLQWLTNAEDDARVEAERTAARVAQATADDAERVEAEAGDSDPLLAVEDALRTFDADEIVVVVRRGEEASWLEEGAGETIAERFFQAVRDEEWISLTAGAAMLQKQQQAALAANRPLKLRMQVRSFDAVCHMVASGLGVAVLPKGASLPILKTMKLSWRPLADAWAQRRLLVATTAGARDEGVTSLVDFLVQPSQNAKAKGHNK